MGFAETMRILSNINCGLASCVSYMEQKQNGVPTPYAINNLCGNLANGIIRNEAAYQMQRRGNPIGNYINMYAGYGNPVSNMIGTMGIMSACSPWMFFNMSPYMYCMPPMGFFANMGMGFGSYSITTTTSYGCCPPRHFCC